MKKIKFIHFRIAIYFITIILVALLALGNIKTSCYFYDKFGLLCPACGLSRATISIVTFDIKSALMHNTYYACILVPLILILSLNDIYIFIKRYVFKKNAISFVEIILGEKNFEYNKYD